MKIKKSKGRILFEVINYTLLTLFCILCLLPVLHVLFASLSDPNKLNTHTGLILWPEGFTLQGYALVFTNKQLLRGFANTIIYVTVATGLGMLITVVSAYVLSKKDMLWNNVITFLISFTMLFSGGLVPTYLIMQKLHLLDNPLAVILPFCVSVFNLIIMRTAFASLPPDLEESARLDGANDLIIIFQVLSPLVKATIATITLYYIIAHWNSWFPAAMYIKNRDYYPLQLVLREILIINDTSSATTASNLMGNLSIYKLLVKYSTIIVSSAPMIIIYPFVMKYFKTGVMIGSIKG